MPPKPLTRDDKKTLKKLGDRIKQHRVRAGYTSAERFAYDNDINRTQYVGYEAGKNITIPSLGKVLKALGVTFEEFFKGFD